MPGGSVHYVRPQFDVNGTYIRIGGGQVVADIFCTELGFGSAISFLETGQDRTVHLGRSTSGEVFVVKIEPVDYNLREITCR